MLTKANREKNPYHDHHLDSLTITTMAIAITGSTMDITIITMAITIIIMAIP